MEPFWAAVVAAIGIIMGLITVLVGLQPKFEFPIWSGAYLVVAFLAKVGSIGGFGLFVAGSLVGGLGTGILQTTLIHRYREHNPWYADAIPDDPKQAARKFIPFAAAMGLAFGLIFAGISWGLGLVFP